jgi:hypothetical protein
VKSVRWVSAGVHGNPVVGTRLDMFFQLCPVLCCLSSSLPSPLL